MFYTIQNINRCSPEYLIDKEYLNIKSSSNGEETIIFSIDKLDNENCWLIEKKHAQIILDDWINSEEEPQDSINLESFLQDNDNLKPILLEEIKLQRMSRCLKEDDCFNTFPLTIKKMSPMELELFTNKLKNILGVK